GRGRRQGVRGLLFGRLGGRAGRRCQRWGRHVNRDENAVANVEVSLLEPLTDVGRLGAHLIRRHPWLVRVALGHGHEVRQEPLQVGPALGQSVCGRGGRGGGGRLRPAPAERGGGEEGWGEGPGNGEGRAHPGG